MSTNRRADAFNRFLVDAKTYWMAQVFPALRRDYEQRRGDRVVETTEQVAELLNDSPLYQYFMWLERHVQKSKYSGRWGLTAMAETARPNLLADLADVPDLPLDLDETVAVPDYYAAVDTHQHPGNLTGDDLAGYVYQGSAMSTQPGSTTGQQLHHRFADLVAEHGTFGRIADLGCGFGKSTLPLAQRFPQTEVIGFDLSAPCLKLAARDAERTQARNLRYRQADATRTGCPSGSFDLVTSTMLLHEMPTDAIRDVLAETHRLLAPGGLAVHLDFRASDPFLRFILHGHGRRNNEPYMEAFDRMDVAAAHQDLGFEPLRVATFAETDGATDAGNPNWRYPWTVFIARKPGAVQAAA